MKKKLSAVEKLQTQINQLGFSNNFNAYKFLSISLITALVLMFCLYYFTDVHYLLVPVIAIAYYYLLYYLVIIYAVDKRTKRLDNEALEFFEVLTLALESGRNLETSLNITVANIDSELSDELQEKRHEASAFKEFVVTQDKLNNDKYGGGK